VWDVGGCEGVDGVDGVDGVIDDARMISWSFVFVWFFQ
jgi:hypothetical protein